MVIIYILITVIILFAVIFAGFLLMSKFILNMVFGKRCDGNLNLKYFTVEDFENLDCEKIEFKSDKGQMLRGNVYFNKKIKEKDIKGLLVFVHGMGGGHLSYATEINTLASNGYKVFAYDNTGTCESEGKLLNGFYQSVLDLKCALEFIKSNEDLNKYNLGLIGHSWGAYTVCQSLKFDYDVKAVVSLSGCDSVERLFCYPMGVFGRYLKPFMFFWNKLKFGDEGITSTIDILKESNNETSILLMHGNLDKSCPIECSLLRDSLNDYENKENIQCIVFDEKYHNVYQTLESEKYLNKIFGKIEEYKKKYKGKELEEKSKEVYDSIDYKKITEEDKEVLETIVEFFDNTINV